MILPWPMADPSRKKQCIEGVNKVERVANQGK
jgi:hypothetical protein